MKTSAIVLAAITVGAANAAWSQDESGPSAPSASSAIADRFYISPMASYILTDPDRGTDDGLGGTVAFGKQFHKKFAFEVEAHYSSYDAQRGGDSASLLGGGVRGLLWPTGSGLFALGGLGYGRFKDHPGADPDYDSVLWTLGVGYLIGPFDLLVPGVSIRTEVALRSDMHDGDRTSERNNNALNDGLVNVGLLIPLGVGPVPEPPPAAPETVDVVPVEAPVDTDGDGVPDGLDQCPDTPAGTAVDATGCPLPPPAPACKTPEPGQPVTLEGCAAGDKIVLRGVSFEFDKARLTANAKTILDSVSEAMKSAPNLRVEVGGHTDARGSDEYNQRLSEKRAASVVAYLAGHGVGADRMQARGYGESEPIADNETDEGRELNRRVELKIIE